MKQSQWVLAVLVLAVMVFVVTFAMNYLGEGGRSLPSPIAQRSGRVVRFFWKESPPVVRGDDQEAAAMAAPAVFEYEAHSLGYQDFWFRNDNEQAVKVGLFSKGCKCTGVDLYFLNEDGLRKLTAEAVALVGTAGGGPFTSAGSLNSRLSPPTLLSPLLLQTLAAPQVQKGADGPHELLQLKEFVSVPGGAVGWVRLRWTGERIGPQSLDANLWMDDPTSKAITLQVRVRIQEPVRVAAALPMGLLRDEALAAPGGVTSHILCWSSTRNSLRLEAKAPAGRGSSTADAFTVGDPQPLTVGELRELQEQNDQQGGAEKAGPVLCAYRIPVNIRAMAPDGKTPFDLGPFIRRVTVSSPDLPGEPKQVTVTGRVRGQVEIGNDENGEINFGSFPLRTGKLVKISLQSDVPGLTLSFDRERTLKFLRASVGKPEKGSQGQQVWSLSAEVLPGKASGVFPRREDPLYEDSAIYLKAVIPGKAPRSVRIAVHGTANLS